MRIMVSLQLVSDDNLNQLETLFIQSHPVSDAVLKEFLEKLKPVLLSLATTENLNLDGFADWGWRSHKFLSGTQCLPSTSSEEIETDGAGLRLMNVYAAVDLATKNN